MLRVRRPVLAAFEAAGAAAPEHISDEGSSPVSWSFAFDTLGNGGFEQVPTPMDVISTGVPLARPAPRLRTRDRRPAR